MAYVLQNWTLVAFVLFLYPSDNFHRYVRSRAFLNYFIMLDEIINNRDLDKYLSSFDSGMTIFHEGDQSQDLYILVSGQLDIFKGKNKITEIIEKGSFFGEMSFLLGQERTATAKTKTAVKTVCIPKEEITTFLHDFPELAGEITKLLAKRLDETSRTLYRLKEFCDQLPDAVVATDAEGKIITWNAAAENLYGRPWNRMKAQSMEEIYDEPNAYRKLFDELKTKRSVREKILKVRHPQKGTRFISTSTSLLYDDNNQFHGVLSLGRDVTAVQKLEKKYKRTYFWFSLFALVSILFALVVFGDYSSQTKKQEALYSMDQTLENQIYQDYLILSEKFIGFLLYGDKFNSKRVMGDFFRSRRDVDPLYTGLVLLDANKNVFASHALNENSLTQDMAKSSYNGIEFQGDGGAIHRILTLYRSDPDHPMGKKSVEIAFVLKQDDLFLGWLIFQIDPDFLMSSRGIDESALRMFQFKGPGT